MSTLYVRTDGNDSHDGSANDPAHAKLTNVAAVSAASSGDTIIAVDGPFLEANPIDLGPKSLTFIGQKTSGAGMVEIQYAFNEAASGGGALLNGGFVSNIYANGTADISSSAIGQAPAGWISPASSQTVWASATYLGCRLTGNIDGMFLRQAATKPTITATATRCTFESAFDTSNVNSLNPATNWPGLTLVYIDSSFTVTGPTPAIFATHLYRGIAVGCGSVRAIGGTIMVNGNDDDITEFVSGIALYGSSAAAPRFEGIGVTIATNSNTQNNEYSVYIPNTGGKACLTNCIYDVTKVYASGNQPSVVAVAGGVRKNHAPGTTYHGTFTNGTNTAFDGMKVNGSVVTATVSGGSFSWAIPANYATGVNLLVQLTDSAASESAAIDVIGVVPIQYGNCGISIGPRIGI